MHDTVIIPHKLHKLNSKRYFHLPEYRQMLCDAEAPIRERFDSRVSRTLKTIEISFQGELIKTRCHSLTDRSDRPGGDRGKIRKFSKASRKNMLETVSRFDWSKGRATFMTLTYHVPETNAQTCKTHLRIFLKRIYRAYGLKTVLWRMDVQPKRFAIKGQFAWHFHLIILDLPYVPRTTKKKDGLLDWWRDITGQPSITQLDIQLIRTAKKARSYVAKYSGKETDALAYLDYLANLPDELLPGRFWGIENRQFIPWAALVRWVVTVTSEFSGYFDFKRACRHQWKGVNGSKYEGFSVFVSDIKAWENMLHYLIRSEYSAKRKDGIDGRVSGL